jgi:hypothetical protein
MILVKSLSNYKAVLQELDRNRQNRPVRPVPDPNRFKPASRTAFDRFRTEPVFFAKEAHGRKSKVIFLFFF